jgi:hypothetical protein
MMTVCCSQPGYTLAPKMVNRSLAGTNNYKPHYEKCHPGIPITEKDAKAQAAAKNAAKKHTFFEAQPSDQTYNQRHRTLLLEFITQNNLSFSLVDQEETKTLFIFFSPNTK